MLLHGCGELGQNQKKKHFLHKGNIAFKEKLYQQSIRYYSEAIQLDSTFEQAHNNLGIVLHKTGSFDKARDAFSRCINLDPNFTEAYFNRSNTFYELHEFQLALDDLKEIEKEYQPKEAIEFSKGLAYSGLKQYDSAKVMFERTLASDPSNIENHINLATTLYYLGDFKKSRSLCNSALEINARFTDAYNLLGLIMTETAQLDSAQYFFTRGLDTESNNAYILNNRGFVFLKQLKYSEALSDINESIVIDPDNAWAYRNKGIYYLETDDLANAQRLLKQAVSMDNDLKLSQYYLGLAYQNGGSSDLACEAFLISSEMGEQEGKKAYQQSCQ